MNHEKSKVIVFCTGDYKRFRFRKGNRNTNEKKQEKIMAEINDGNDILDQSPILVSENGNHLDIDDGQNRFEICKKLGRPVHYIIRKEQMSLYNLAKNNSNVEKWQPADYIRCHSEDGKEDYVQLDKFQKKYKLAIGLCLMLLSNGDILKASGYKQPKLKDDFERGHFKIEKMKEARLFMETCKSFEQFPGWNTRPFLIAMARILAADLADMDVLVKKFNRDPSKLSIQPTWKDYCFNLQRIYNIDNSKQKPIY